MNEVEIQQARCFRGQRKASKVVVVSRCFLLDGKEVRIQNGDVQCKKLRKGERC